MPVVLATAIPPESTLEADVCVAGAGPAGLAVTAALDDAGLGVVLLEAGHEDTAEIRAGSSQLETVGRALESDWPLRGRGFGGTLGSWHGRCVRLERLDLERLDWVAESGWPISFGELTEFEERAARFLGLAPLPAAERPRWPAESDGVRPQLHRWARSLDRKGPARARCARRMRASARTRVVLGATAARLVLDESGRRLVALRARGEDGRGLSVSCRAFVVACGGLETPRLLLLSRDRNAAGVGNDHDVVGRYYMNHPRTEGSARLRLDRSDLRARRLLRRLLEHWSPRRASRVQVGFELTPERRRTERLLACGGFFYGVPTEALRSLRDRSGRGALRAVARAAPALAGALVGRLTGHAAGLGALVLVDQTEQVPDPESRVTLGRTMDRHGDPVARVDWRIGEGTAHTLRRFHELLGRHLDAVGVGRLESTLLGGGAPRFTDAAHPMGTTRMSASPRSGVVDEQCRVHGVDNLYIAGSSVFPTGGHGAPTLTIVALALRLGAHLAERLGGGRAR